MGNLVYLAYGSGPHLKEVEFSLLSAVHCNGGRCHGISATVFTDCPDAFGDLNVRVERISADQMRIWAGPEAFGLRRKIEALEMAIHLLEGPCLLVDTDTYFTRSPREVFDRIGPGQSVMHVMEGYVGHLAAVGPARTKFHGLTIDLPATRYEFVADTPMWNSGVVGIHPSDVKLFGEILPLCDELARRAPSWISEQLAFSSVLRRHTKVVGCKDAIFHFHPRDIREPFRNNLAGLLEHCAGMELRERAAALYEHRPRPRPMKMWKARVKRMVKPIGLCKYDLETSV